MGWLILLLLVSPAFYFGVRVYNRGQRPLTVRGFLVAMCFAAALAVVVLLLSSQLVTDEGTLARVI